MTLSVRIFVASAMIQKMKGQSCGHLWVFP